ncbi:hypothetical protein AB8A05_29670 [Tardiphaga sp. 538_B7_N1_4]|uniref:hypothetical protein n=1 Tax=Tardiphaga sp. 538_B7_N1_4 TaxID=3240778 RepID=UPI003F269C27
MFEKVVTWLKVVKPEPQDEPADAKMKELAELIDHGGPDGETLNRMAKLLGKGTSGTPGLMRRQTSLASSSADHFLEFRDPLQVDWQLLRSDGRDPERILALVILLKRAVDARNDDD